MKNSCTYLRNGGLLVCAISVLLTAGCGDAPVQPKNKTSAIPKPASNAAKEANDELADAPEVAYLYSPIGKRDPFRSFFEEFNEKEKQEGTTELQTFEIDQLKLIAIITGRATPYAMVQDPSGKGHTLTRGTLIGKNWGRVSTITQDCVVVKEEYRNYTGRKVTNTVPMCLPKPEELKLD